MLELCWAVLILGIFVVINWAMGIYDKIGAEKLTWNWKEFGRGLAKIVIVAGSIIGLGFAWEYSGIDLTGAGLEPKTLTTAASVYYAYRAIRHLSNILNIKQIEKN